MGSFFKECGHPRSRWSKCSHSYKIRYRSAAGRQLEESGFATQDAAVERLTEIYNAKKAAPRGRAKAERIARYGAMRFEEYATGWKAGQRDLGPASVVHLESLLNIHLLPLLGSRRMNTFDHKVVEGFLQTLERNGIGLAAQANAFDKLKAILLDANRLGLFDDNPVDGVKPPQYDPKRVVIPSPEQLRQIRTAGDDSFLLVADLMSGCGMRNGEAFAVNLNNIVADDVYRITEQVNRTTCGYERLKHRKAGEYRDVPLPDRVRQTIEWYASKHGTVDGYLLRHPSDPTRTFPHYHIANQWQRIKKAGQVDIPEGMVVYGMRHFFASNCLTHASPSPTSPSGWATRPSRSPSRSTATSCPAPSAKPPKPSTTPSPHEAEHDGELDWSRRAFDSVSVRAVKGALDRTEIRPTVASSGRRPT